MLLNPNRCTAAIAAVLAFAAVSCSDGPDTTTTPPIDIDLTPAEFVAIDNTSGFGLDLIKAIPSEGDNVIVSPLSAAMMLAMSAHGASGEARAEIVDVLFGSASSAASLDDLDRACKQLLDALPRTDPKSKVAIANSVWYADYLTLNQDFENAMQTTFDARIGAVDFATERGIHTVNDWVSSATRGLIDRVIDEPNPALMVSIINALAFEGEWARNFSDAKPASFTCSDGSSVTVDMMSKKYIDMVEASGNGFRSVTDIFSNGAFSISYILPDGSIDELLANTTIGRITEVLDAQRYYTGTLRVPKFSVSYKTELYEPLRSMGITRIFDKDGADRIFDNCPISCDMSQTVSFRIDEKGAKAAAESFNKGEVMFDISAEPFVLDRPFLLLVREKSTGVILFIGRIERP